MDGCEAKVQRLNPVNIETFTVQREPVLLRPPPPHGVHALYCTPSVLYLCVHHVLEFIKDPFMQFFAYYSSAEVHTKCQPIGV